MVASDGPKGKRFLVGDGQPISHWIKACPYATTLSLSVPSFRGEVVCSLGCKRWGCEFCGRRRVVRVACRVEKAAPNKMMTLTCNSKAFESPRAAFDAMRVAFSKLIQKWRRHHGPIEYLRILESHKNGFPHFHCLLRAGYVSQAWLSRQWAELAQSRIVDIREIKDVESTYFYVVKYLAKQTYIAYTDRRLSQSRRFFVKEPKLDCPWGPHYKIGRVNLTPAAYLEGVAPGTIIEQITPTAWGITGNNKPIDWGKVDWWIGTKLVGNETEEEIKLKEGMKSKLEKVAARNDLAVLFEKGQEIPE